VESVLIRCIKKVASIYWNKILFRNFCFTVCHNLTFKNTSRCASWNKARLATYIRSICFKNIHNTVNKREFQARKRCYNIHKDTRYLENKKNYT